VSNQVHDAAVTLRIRLLLAAIIVPFHERKRFLPILWRDLQTAGLRIVSSHTRS
jgi:hypothetical protein